ncbi:MAG TPA: hypothetical protein VFZ37_07935 [Jiangellaceae bacterium]
MWGWVSPVGESTVAFAVMDDDGGVLASRVLRVDDADVQNWDAVVSAFGYERLGRWRPAGGIFWCVVEDGRRRR